ncbi:MAG: isoprenylcysteine carboxylmethyltransferase family protein [Cyclobacteriaceae bacterium]
MIDYIVLFLAWSIYLFLHSTLASSKVKQLQPFSAKHYRLLYSIISTLGLILLVYLMALVDPHYFYAPTDSVRYVGMVLSSWGVILIIGSFRNISTKSFLGLKEEKENRLVRTGLHSRMRHPIYTGTILLLVGMFVAVPSATVLVSTATIFLYLPIGIYLEEKKLIEEFGDDYLKYKREVKSLFPGLF